MRCSETLWKCERDAQGRPVGAGGTQKVIPKPSKSHPELCKNHPETNKKHPETSGKSTRNHTKVIPAIRVRCSETLCKCERDAQDRLVSASGTRKVIPKSSKSTPKPLKTHPGTKKMSSRNQRKVTPKPRKSHPGNTCEMLRNPL